MLPSLGAGLRTLLRVPVFFIYTIFQSAKVNRMARRGDPETLPADIDEIAQVWTQQFLDIAPITLNVEGLENIDTDEQYIVVSNHLSNFDIPAMVRALPVPTRFISKHEVSKIPIFGEAAVHAGVVMIDRDSVRANHEALNTAIEESLGKGYSILVFAEGTRSRSGEMGEFRRGAARIALATGVDILPVVIHGTYDVNPPGSPVIYPGEVTVRILPPIPVDGLTQQDVPALTAEVRRQVSENYDEMAKKAHQS